MRLLPLLLLLPVLGSCNPSPDPISLGPPAAKALQTKELATDGNLRLQTLSTQVPLDANAIFTSYQPRGPIQWSSNWTRRIDLTGVSWSQKQAGTAITPRHLVLAAHYPLRKGKLITFHDRSGKPHSRTIIQTQSLRKRTDEARADITVALLDRPLPPEIKTYRLLPPRSDYPQSLPQCPVLVTEQGRKLFIHQVRAQARNTISFQKNPNYPAPLYKGLVKGDSGNPSFLLVGGEPVLVETHTGGGSGSGPFYSAPKVFTALQEIVAQLDPSYKIKTVPLDPALAPALPKPPKKTPATRPSPKPTTTPTGETPEKRAPRIRRVPAS